MADNNTTTNAESPSANANNDAGFRQVPVNRATEIITPTGSVQTASTTKALSSIFDTMEETGEQDAKAIVKRTSAVKKSEVKQSDEDKQTLVSETVSPPREEKKEPVKPKPVEQTDDENEVPSTGDIFDTKKKEAPAEEAEETKPAAIEEEEEEQIPEEELTVLPHDKPKTARRIRQLLKKIEETNNLAATSKKERDEKEAELAKLREQLKGSEGKGGDAEVNDEIKSQLDELQMYRRQYELESSPELKTKFDDVVQSYEQDIAQVLKNFGAGDSTIKLIETHGGWRKLGSSNQKITLKDGEEITGREYYKRIIAAIEDISPADVDQLRGIVSEQIRTEKNKQAYIKEEKQRAKEYFEGLTKRQQQQLEEQQKVAKENEEAIKGWVSQVEAEDWIKDPEIPADADPGKVAELREEKEIRKQLRQVLRASLSIQSRDQLLDVVKDSVLYHSERRKVAKMQKELESLREQLKAKATADEKARQATRTTKGGSLTVGATPTPTKQDQRPRDISAAFDAVAAGEVE